MKKGCKTRLWILVVVLLTPTFDLSAQDITKLKEQDPVSLYGTISVSTAYNTIKGIDPRQPPFSYVITGNPTLKLYGVDIPLSFMFSNYQRNLQLPFNKFGVSPTYKDYTVHLGYRNVTFSPFTLSGRTFFGAGLEATPGLLRFGFVYGRFQKAIEENLTLLGGEMNRSLIPSFKRTGYSVKLGVGDKKNYLDFIVLKGSDDPMSIVLDDSLDDLTPEENAALGISTQFHLAEKITFKTDVGLSAYTRDLNQVELPLGENGQFDFIKGLITPRVSSQVGIAALSTLTYKAEKFSLNAQYRRIDPGYKTMGAYYFQTDIEHYLVGTTTNIGENKLLFKGDIGFQRDNVKGNRLVQTNKTIGQAHVAWNPNQNAGLTIQYSNFGITQVPGLISISDTTLLRNINQNLVIQPRYLFNTGNFSHMVNGMVNYADLNDKSDRTITITQVKSLTSQASYSITWTPQGLSLSAGYNHINSQISVGETVSAGIILGLSKLLLDKKLQAQINFTANRNTFEGTPYGNTSRLTGNLHYKAGKNHVFAIQLYRLVNNSEQDVISKSFTESVAKFTYTYRFNTLKES